MMDTCRLTHTCPKSKCLKEDFKLRARGGGYKPSNSGGKGIQRPEGAQDPSNFLKNSLDPLHQNSRFVTVKNSDKGPLSLLLKVTFSEVTNFFVTAHGSDKNPLSLLISHHKKGL